MWLLESELFGGRFLHFLGRALTRRKADATIGRKLWLRPGKLYLFGRTGAERKYMLLLTPPDSRIIN